MSATTAGILFPCLAGRHDSCQSEAMAFGPNRESLIPSFHIVCSGTQEIKLCAQCDSHCRGQHCKAGSKVAVVAPTSKHMRYGGTGEYTDHVHYTVGCRSLSGRYELTQDRHVVRVENPIACAKQNYSLAGTAR